ncbi:MAG: ATP synthase F0 subunit C [Myxococcales bacterium]|nr:ATP synthase F0 subunit C [Myxococcales bacterium]
MNKSVFSMLSTLVVMLAAMPALAAGEGEAAAMSGSGAIALAAGLCMCIGTLGGALGQGRTAAAALEGIARNPQAAPKVQTPMIIALALTESLVLFSFVIAFFLQTKVG